MGDFMDLAHYTRPRDFWKVTTLGIVGSVVGVSFIEVRTSLEHIYGTYLALALELAFVSGICVGLLQSSRMPQLSSPSKASWVVTAVLATTIGWVIVFAIVTVLVKLFPNLPIFSDKIVLALFNGLFIGGSMGAIVGLITGIIQA